MHNVTSSTSEPAVSVIVPVHNRRDVIVRAVTSLLQQDFAAPYEIIVIDDGSTDGTADVVVNVDPRVRVVRTPNGGAAVARSRGIVAARAPVVSFLDSDDIALPHSLSSLWEGLHRDPSVVLSYGRVEEMDGRPFSIEKLPTDLTTRGVLSDPLLALLRIGCFTTSMNLMAFRHVALACSRGRGRFRAANDYDFTLRAACHGTFAFVNAATMRCDRSRSDGIGRTKGALQVGFAVLAVRDAVTYSGRQDAAVRRAARDRIELIWPSAAVQLAAAGQCAFAARVAMVGLCRAWGLKSFKRLWWALSDSYKVRLSSKAPSPLRPL
jgi:glycosyltransferase involved in cell wall biosynthesis